MKTIAGIEAERRPGTALIFGKSVKVEQKLEELGDTQPTVMRTVIPFQLKSLNEETRTIDFVGSTPATDRYGDVVQQNWDLGNFIKNPVIPWGHDYSMPPVAKALEVGYHDGNLTFRGQFATAEEYAWADTIYKLYKGGYLRAFSVGFIPLEYEGDWDTGYTFTKAELLEVSCVTVPANPEALVLAYREGVLSESERKSMADQATRLFKTLTGDDLATENELMEETLKQLTGVMTEVRDLLSALKSADEPDPKDNPEDPSDKPADNDPAGGADNAKGLQLSDPEVQKAIREGVTSALHQVKGKID